VIASRRRKSLQDCGDRLRKIQCFVKQSSASGFNVRIPEDLIIPDAKITQYLLVLKARNDKSRFLAQAGFTQENPEALRLAIQSQAMDKEAIEEKSNEYGTFYQVKGELIGVNGVSLSVVTVWLQRQNRW
jgi:hypothetical protein